jgi:hypothetical protein
MERRDGEERWRDEVLTCAMACFDQTPPNFNPIYLSFPGFGKPLRPSRRIPGFGKSLRPTRSRLHKKFNGAECLLNTVHGKTHCANRIVLGGDH